MIVDASVAIKWLVLEDESEAANRLLERSDLVAPDLITCELANTIWKKWKRGELSGMPSRFRSIISLLDEVVPMSALMERATEIAIELDHPAYDCFYLALAETRRDVVVTADRRMITKVSQTGFAPMLVPLASLVP